MKSPVLAPVATVPAVAAEPKDNLDSMDFALPTKRQCAIDDPNCESCQ